MNRRHFLAAASTVAILPRHVLGGAGVVAPSDTLNLAGIGAGGMGGNYLENLSSENIVALADVDDLRAAPTYARFPDARRYKDFRELLDKEANHIDGVVIGTPDHTHAVAALPAFALGKHVYCAKPLARTIRETRLMTEAARKAGVATQMSTQQNAHDDHRVIAEMIWDGAIGPVREVHIWDNRPIWPQGTPRPADTPPIPDTLDWDLWLGPAPERPYHSAYVPFAWRGWQDFGTGALGDMGCHHFDPVFRALHLTAPETVHASSTDVNEETWPHASIVHYGFPARGDMPPVRVTWYDGGLKPPRPDGLGDHEPMGVPNPGGAYFVGDKGVLMTDGTGHNPRVLSASGDADDSAYEMPAPALPRSIGHYQEWIEACKGGPKAGAHFDYGGPVTEAVLLGNIAILSPGKTLRWDAASMRITNDKEANLLLDRSYREGWAL